MKRNHYGLSMGLLGAAFCGAVLVSLLLGRFAISPREVWRLLWARLLRQTPSDTAAVVFWTSRLPRVLAAALIGMALSASGCAYQGVFRNPMVSPDLLGASAGAGFGAALGFLLGFPTVLVQLCSFLCGIAAVGLTWGLGKTVAGEYDNRRMLLVLCGIVVSALFQALISIIKYVADPYNTLPNIAFWLMGGLNYVTATDAFFLAIPVILGLIPLLLLRWRINLLAFGDEEASAMGVPVRRLQGVVIVCATLMTAASVAVGGMIGWVGLIVPHFARMLVGSDQKRLLPCSVLLGGTFLVLVDDVARCLFAQEIPIGILTALIGAPLFMYLLFRGRRGFV
jgi:iron complex transport system permease protein